MIKKYSQLNKEIVKITPKMVELFHNRTARHKEAVNLFFRPLADKFGFNPNHTQLHDNDKYSAPILQPYVILSWQRKHPEYKVHPRVTNLINKATLKHVIENPHHPEYYNIENAAINETDRDKPSDKLIDASPMPNLYLCEMCADWAAVGYELDNSSPRGWANENVGVRWQFTDEQTNTIYTYIKEIEKLLKDRNFLNKLKEIFK